MKISTITNLSWIFVFSIAIIIFYISSLTFPIGPPGPPNYNAIIYHFFAFFNLAFFLILAIVKDGKIKFLFIAILIAIFYGVLDEVHQLFVPERTCVFGDFLINSAGILTASFIYIFFILNMNLKSQNYLHQ